MRDGAVQTGYADVNGTRLYYETQGVGAPLLFLHGFTFDRRMWRRQVEGLAAKYRVITYDARGFGRSELPDTTAYRHCDDAAALCDHLGVRRVVVVGHSIGGHQMLEMALSRAELVAGWVGVCVSGLARIPFPEDVMQLFAAVRTAARNDGIETAKRSWSASGWFASAREVPTLAAEIDLMLADYSGWHWTHDNPARNIEPPVADRLSALAIPALVITGARDLDYNTRIGDVLSAEILGATSLRVPRAGHMANMECPEETNRAILELAGRIDF